MTLELWLARDIDNGIALYYSEPVLKNGYFEATDDNEDCYIFLEDEDFPEVTHENSPRRVILTSVEI